MGRLKITQACARCGNDFHPWPARKSKTRLYCSNKCRSVPIARRFWANVHRADGCWLWTGNRDIDGYGRIWNGGTPRTMRSHRVSWEIHNGVIPSGMDVLHRCDNPPCVNPAHLFLGTNSDNVVDRTLKGRSQRGEAHGMAKLNEADVTDIRQRYSQGNVSQEQIAREYGVTQTLISCVVMHKNWKHVV